jgi:hypothetical protein
MAFTFLWITAKNQRVVFPGLFTRHFDALLPGSAFVTRFERGFGPACYSPDCKKQQGWGERQNNNRCRPALRIFRRF